MIERGRSSVPVRAHVLVLAPLVVALGAIVANQLGLRGTTSYDIAWTAAACSAVAGTLLAWGRALPHNRERWSLWAGAAGAWLFGQLAWDVFGVVGFPESPNLADLGFWAFAVLVMVSMIRIPGGSRAQRSVTLIEAFPLIVAAVALSFAELWNTAQASPLPLAAKVSALVYPALYIAAAVLTLQAIVGGALRRLDVTAARLVMGGVAAVALAFILWSTQLLDRTYVPGRTLLDPLWVLGLSSIAVGGLVAARHPEEAAEPQEPTYRSGIVPAGMFLILPVALIQPRVAHAPMGIKIAIEVGLMFCGAALVARSTLLVRGQRAILARERAALGRLEEREAELARVNRELVEDSRRDPLTGVSNRRALADDLPVLEELYRERGERFALALCDADHFKAYNDRLGHLAGDQALRMIAATARGALRAGDAAYRYGGEELLLVLRNVTDEEAVKVADRVRTAVERAGFRHPYAATGLLTISIGVATGGGDTGDLLARADAALYEAKRRGRNRVVAATEDAPIPPAPRPRLTADEPVPRHLRSMLAISRAAAGGHGPMRVLEALADTIRNELFFQVVVINLLDPRRDEVRAVLVKGDQEATEALLDTTSQISEWQRLLASGEEIHGAIWLPAGSYDLDVDLPTWTPPAVAAPPAGGWHPDDSLLLHLRAASGEVLGIVSVDQPVLGRRPTEQELGVLMAVVDHAGLSLEQAQRGGEPIRGQSQELRLAAMMLLAESLDMRDPSTVRHSRTVGRYARETAKALELDKRQVERIHAAGVLHDLGNLGIADTVLRHPGPLGEGQWREMRRHPEMGARILEHAGIEDIGEWVRDHHERIDGGGYPAGLRGPEIPLAARILAVADAYEAMVADRPYRRRMSREHAREELLRCAGSQFDPDVVQAFLTVLDRDDDGLRMLEPVA